ncbi:MAG: FHA domain-containing protein [Gaiellales bacterium]
MICRTCHRQVSRDDPFCPTCGAPRWGEAPQLELVLGDGRRIPLEDSLTIGRAEDNDLSLDDRSVSRRHARIVVHDGRASISDSGSSYGTFLDGNQIQGERPLRPGTTVRIGDTELRVDRHREQWEAGETILVRAGSTLVRPQLTLAGPAAELGPRPRLRSGWALKRLDELEGAQRYVVRDLEGNDFMRMGEEEAELLLMLDGTTALPELVAEAERRLGADGPARLATLLAELGDRGMLAGIEGGRAAGPRGRLARMFTPRDLVVPGIGNWVEWLYVHGGFLLFTRAGRAGVTGLAAVGFLGFVVAIADGSVTPLVVAGSLGLGSVVFVLGRFLIVAVHELAHALTVASYGRRVPRAGLKVVLVFPYAFVDTSEGWFEPRRHRIAIGAAGPVSDAAVGGAFALVAAFASGVTAEVAFQLALGAYLGGLFNLNPFLDRDGYHILVDTLGQPGLRKRSRERLARRLAGQPVEASDSRVLEVYAVAGIAWLIVAAGLAMLLSSRYYDLLVSATHSTRLAWAVLATFDVLVLVPVMFVLGAPLIRRARPRREVDRVGA